MNLYQCNNVNPEGQGVGKSTGRSENVWGDRFHKDSGVV